MRKPRDFDAELISLNDKARRLKDRRIIQLGELVVATGAGGLPIEQLAGALIVAVETDDADMEKDWRARGTAFFQRNTSKAVRRSQGDLVGAAKGDRAIASPGSDAREN